MRGWEGTILLTPLGLSSCGWSEAVRSFHHCCNGSWRGESEGGGHHSICSVPSHPSATLICVALPASLLQLGRCRAELPLPWQKLLVGGRGEDLGALRSWCLERVFSFPCPSYATGPLESLLQRCSLQIRVEAHYSWPMKENLY